MTLRDEFTAPNYVIGVHEHPDALDAAEWNALLMQQPSPTPFMRHEYLLAMQASGSATPATGWGARFITLRSPAGELQAACAVYLKSHSYGEYVFDWAWADAYRRHGLRYYPKALCAVPFTPVPGTRLMARSAQARQALAGALRQWADDSRLSSAHVVFVDAADQQALQAEGWMLREGVQFHWQQDRQSPLPDFATLLARLQREKRKKVQQERRRVREAGIEFTTHEGQGITSELWDFFHHCYTLTYQAHHSTPYLARQFFTAMARTMADHWVMFVARRDDQPVAVSLVAVDRPAGAAWGRYWGCVEHVPCLHFEACYYQPLEWCLRNGFQRFEGGAQGEHKMARGLLPVKTASAHWLRDSRFADAVAGFLASEGQGIAEYVNELHERNPFKSESMRD